MPPADAAGHHRGLVAALVAATALPAACALCYAGRAARPGLPRLLACLPALACMLSLPLLLGPEDDLALLCSLCYLSERLPAPKVRATAWASTGR